jgi:hypothetical protein
MDCPATAMSIYSMETLSIADGCVANELLSARHLVN